MNLKKDGGKVLIVIIGLAIAYYGITTFLNLGHIPDVKFVDNTVFSQSISKGKTVSVLINVENKENKTVNKISIRTILTNPDPNYFVIKNPEISIGTMGAHAKSEDQYVTFIAKNETASSMTFNGQIGIYVNNKNTDNKTITFTVLP